MVFRSPSLVPTRGGFTEGNEENEVGKSWRCPLGKISPSPFQEEGLGSSFSLFACVNGISESKFLVPTRGWFTEGNEENEVGKNWKCPLGKISPDPFQEEGLGSSFSLFASVNGISESKF